MDIQILDRALHESCYDLDATIKTLSKLNLAEDNTNNPTTRVSSHHDSTTPEKTPIIPNNETTKDWVELFMGEMVSCTNVEDARAKAAELLNGFEKSIGAGLEKENMVLKRAVCVLLGRRRDLEETRRREVSRLNEMVAHQQEQLRLLEAANYGLKLHLNQALSSSKFGNAGSFNPDIF